jgi:predicted unusual protein kinase regulating ubiquinone biosynthesis (AarF/ABC1/UbiB family)
MFISTEAKTKIVSDLDLATKQISALRTVVATLEKRITDLETAKPVKAKKTKKVMTPEQKAKQREYQRLYKARKKEEANNLATAVELLKENNVSS